jgi:hypothetical protein
VPTSKPTPIPFPLSSFPGGNPQESAGRLINAYVEQLGTGAPAAYVWRRSPGLSQFAAAAQSGYRGGLIVNNISYETWANNASTVDGSGDVASIGTGVFPGTKKIAIARNQASPTPDVVAVDVDNGAYVLDSAGVAAATASATIAAGTIASAMATINGSYAPGDVVTLKFTNIAIAGFPITVSYTLGSIDDALTIALALTIYINSNAALAAAGITATSIGGVITLAQSVTYSSSTTLSYTVTGGVTVTLSPATGILSNYVPGQSIVLTFENEYIDTLVNNTITAQYVILSGDTPTTIAAGLAAAINANATLSGLGITATSALAVLTISQNGSVANSTAVLATIPESGSLTVTFNPASGVLAGGTGTVGAFTGSPTLYNGQFNLPQPNSICFQDGYFFFTVAAGQCYATALNGLTMNALTYITAEAKADVILLRGIAFSGILLLFTTGSCEVWQDAALPAPAFPYSRIAVLEHGLIQSAAIAGWETGFSELLWVAENFAVWRLTPGSIAPEEVSPPDLNRLIEAQVRAGNLLEAGCYIFGGKKFWHLSSPAWTWELNLETRKWNERWSLNSSGNFGRWRGTGGHPAFGKWLIGDELSGNLLWVDVANFTENGAVQLCRLESGAVAKFPEQLRIARADFNFVAGVGISVGNFAMTVLGAAAGADGGVVLTVNSTSQAQTNDVCNVSGVTGTTEANGSFQITVIDATHIELQGVLFVNAYVSGGTAVDVTSPANAQNPQVAISMSKDGGINWGNPLLRQLGAQEMSLRQRAVVKNMGLSGPMGDRWRLDVSDPVDVAFFGGTQSSDPRYLGG